MNVSSYLNLNLINDCFYGECICVFFVCWSRDSWGILRQCVPTVIPTYDNVVCEGFGIVSVPVFHP